MPKKVTIGRSTRQAEPVIGHVAIIGGGIAGLTCALALRRKGIDADVYEVASTVDPVGAGLWVPPNAMQILASLDLADEVERRGVSLSRAELWTTDGGALSGMDFRWAEERWGHGTVSIRRADLHEVLLDALGRDRLHLDRELVELDPGPEAVVCRFADRGSVDAELVIGADGIGSQVRSLLWPDVSFRYAGQTCFRGIADFELTGNRADVGLEVWGGWVRFGYSPVAPGAVYWFAPMSVDPGTHFAPNDVYNRLGRAIGRFPFPVPQILDATPVDSIIQTDLYDLPPLETWAKGSVVLIGDAAHAMTPNLGQGAAQAMEDAVVLSDCLAEARSISVALRRFEGRRRRRVRRVARRSYRFGRIAHWETDWARGARDTILGRIPQGLTRRQLAWLFSAPSGGGG